MGMSFFTELVKSLDWPQKNLAPLAIAQLLIPVFPPGITVSLTVAPARQNYANIYFSAEPGDAIVPNAINYTYTAWGATIYSGMLTAGVIGKLLDIFLPVTAAKTVFIQFTNISGLNQHLELLNKFLVIPGVEDYERIIKAINQRGMSDRAEEMLERLVKAVER